ncbi:MAG: cupin domain protein [Hyphomicrobiales bacterium]|jgi:quercetin dioxygenase-like cupin family protein|nr:cupin domain protein [Hyphomicrobiales bacterium]
MVFSIRRVVTGHDAAGRAVVAIDEIAANLVSRRPGHTSYVIWSNDTTPADNDEDGDAGLRDIADCGQEGAIFRVIEFAPGVAPRMHRTLTVDYAVVISGEILMRLDDSEVTLRAGDCLVQRGTIHDWVNTTDQPCVMAFVLIAAKPLISSGKEMDATG